MTRFVETDIQKLIDLCFEGVNSEGRDGGGSRLVKKILSMTVDEETEPLRLTMRLDKSDYQEGVFCWKGFLYYKWTLSETMPGVKQVINAIGAARPKGYVDTEMRVHLENTRTALRRAIFLICETARQSIAVYDRAFAQLVDGQPLAFREFLLNAPSMFTDLGERLGAVNHVISYWNFRFPHSRLPVVTGEELLDIFSDFESSLSFVEARSAFAEAAS